ncbi:MAG: tRNA (N(6)-L-threonylcarbamoyladenosine(37)-C(2))-methylthiotransferase MtaB, partial [Bacteroidota bacterium]
KRELYVERVTKIKALMPYCCIGVDVIVGFPGETDEDFKETYNFINELAITYLHVFTYSERPNTPANEMEGIVPVHIRRERNEMLRILSEKKKRHFYSQFAGQTRTALFEVSKNKDLMSGFTDNYLKIELPYDPAMINEMGQVKLGAINEEGNFEATLVHEVFA